MIQMVNKLPIFPKSPLFPVAKTKKRYEETKLWHSLSNYCIYNNYERNREAGIHYLCWELSKNEVAKQQIINAAHRFSRYSNNRRTEKLVNEGISRDPKAYERDYRNCGDADIIINLSWNARRRPETQLAKIIHAIDWCFEPTQRLGTNRLQHQAMDIHTHFFPQLVIEFLATAVHIPGNESDVVDTDAGARDR
jgi:hypothetical protein